MDAVPDKYFRGEYNNRNTHPVWRASVYNQISERWINDVLDALDEARHSRDIFKRNWSLNARTARECLKSRFSMDEVEEAWHKAPNASIDAIKEELIKSREKDMKGG